MGAGNGAGGNGCTIAGGSVGAMAGGCVTGVWA